MAIIERACKMLGDQFIGRLAISIKFIEDSIWKEKHIEQSRSFYADI